MEIYEIFLQTHHVFPCLCNQNVENDSGVDSAGIYIKLVISRVKVSQKKSAWNLNDK